MHTLAEILEEGAHDPRLAPVTFTAARMSDDLRSLRVFYSCMGDPAVVAEARAALLRASGYLRSALAERLALRYVPSLSFEFDETMATAERIERLLRGVRDADAQDPEDVKDEPKG